MFLFSANVNKHTHDSIVDKMLIMKKQRLPQGNVVLGAISHAVLQNIGGKMFPDLQSHMLEIEPENNRGRSVFDPPP